MMKMYVDKAELEKWNALLDKDEIDFEAEGVPEDATLFSECVKFENGIWATLKVCSGQTNLWAEMVWFDAEGYEILCSEPSFGDLEGVWEFNPNHEFDVEVVPMDAGKKYEAEMSKDDGWRRYMALGGTLN